MYSLNGKTSEEENPGPEPGDNGDGSLDKPFNVAGATQCIKDNGDAETTEKYYVKGKISSIKYSYSAQYGTATFNISDDGGTESAQFTCYGVYYFGGEAWVEGNTQIAVGDEVIVYGQLTCYSGTYETSNKKAWMYSLNGKTSEEENPGGDNPGGDNPGGDDDSVSFTKEELAAAADKGAKVEMNDVVSFTNSTNYSGTTVTELRIYKGQTLTISAASGYKLTGIEFTCSASGTTKQGPGCWGAGAPEGYTYEGNKGTWAGSAASVAFTATDNQVRIISLTVTYKAD